MSPALNGSSAIRRFECNDAIEVRVFQRFTSLASSKLLVCCVSLSMHTVAWREMTSVYKTDLADLFICTKAGIGPVDDNKVTSLPSTSWQLAHIHGNITYPIYFISRYVLSIPTQHDITGCDEVSMATCLCFKFQMETCASSANLKNYSFNL